MNTNMKIIKVFTYWPHIWSMNKGKPSDITILIFAVDCPLDTASACETPRWMTGDQPWWQKLEGTDVTQLFWTMSPTTFIGNVTDRAYYAYVYGEDSFLGVQMSSGCSNTSNHAHAPAAIMATCSPSPQIALEYWTKPEANRPNHGCESRANL